MKRKPTEIEADLDPKGNRTSRPGGRAAATAVANSKKGAARKPRTGEPTRPGAGAALRALAATKKRKR